MSRLEKKCFIASTSMHLLLVLVLFVGPAFFVSHQEPESLPILNFIPARLTDEKSFGGGSPTAVSPPAPQPIPASAPAPLKQSDLRPPEPEPAKPERKVSKETVKEEADSPRKPQFKKMAEPTPVRKQKEKDTSKSDQAESSSEKKEKSRKQAAADSKENSAAVARAEAEAQARALRAQYLAKLKSLGDSLSQNLSSGTSIEMPGPGGEFYANYAQIVKSKYQLAWSPPNDLADDSATVTVIVIIEREGTVRSFKIKGRAGHPALDKSVERLQRINRIAPFPEGATDSERTFIIDFNLKAKRLSG